MAKRKSSSVKTSDIQKRYDIDFARMERESKEAYKLYFQLFIDQVLPYLKTLVPGTTLDASEADQNRLRQLLQQITGAMQSQFNLGKLQKVTAETFQNIRLKSQKNFEKTLQAQITVAANEKNLTGAIEASKGLISSMSAGMSQDLAAIQTRSANQTGLDLYVQQEAAGGTAIASRVLNGVSAGERWESIARAVLGTANPKSGEAIVRDAPKDSEARKALNKAKFIARNATSTVIGEYDKRQSAEAGIEIYMWQTAEDERVRPTHKSLNQKVFAWNPSTKAPTEIQYGKSSYVKGRVIPQASDPAYNNGAPTYPGQPWNCRCVAVNLIQGIDF